MKNGETPAFSNANPEGNEYFGLTKREYFAAMAMQGLLSANAFEDKSDYRELITVDAVKFADYLLKQLES